jgi:hypothetical protein
LTVRTLQYGVTPAQESAGNTLTFSSVGVDDMGTNSPGAGLSHAVDRRGANK